MIFEFDAAKSASNKLKHGIDFEEARAIWDDNRRVERPAQNVEEPRFQVLGKVGSKLWSAVITYREGRIRIISVRSARDAEKELYG